jgi:hypothetical protein
MCAVLRILQVLAGDWFRRFHLDVKSHPEKRDDLNDLFLGKTHSLRQPVAVASNVAVELGSPTFEASAAGATWAIPSRRTRP